MLPALSEADYLIHLHNGGHLQATFYREQGNELYLFVPQGMIGISKDEVQKIEELKEGSRTSDESSFRRTAEQKVPKVQTSPEEQKTGTVEKEEAVDLKAYKDKKDQMTAELDRLLEKQRQATSAGDSNAKEKIKEEIRKISEKIYQLTDEVTQKNKGKLPAGWWDK